MKLMALMVVAAGCLLAGGCASGGGVQGRAAGSGETGVLFREITVDGRARKYAVYVPRGVESSKPMPLIMFLHGSGECGTDGSKQVMQGLGAAAMWDTAAWPAVIVMPQKMEQAWSWEQDEGLVLAAMEEVRRGWTIDPTRVYLTGLSQGGCGTWAIASRHPEMFAAIAPVCGYLDRKRPGGEFGDANDAAKIAPGLKGVPVWAFHGEKDDVVPASQSRLLAEAVTAAGGDVKLTIYPDLNHGCWDRAYRGEKLCEWLLSHRRMAGPGNP